MTDESDKIIKQYTSSLSSEERQEVGRELLEEAAMTKPPKFVGSHIVWRSRVLFVAVILVYWGMRDFTFASLLDLFKAFALPGAVALFPNELSSGLGRLGLTPAIIRPSPVRVALAVAWFVLLWPLGVRIVRMLARVL